MIFINRKYLYCIILVRFKSCICCCRIVDKFSICITRNTKSKYNILLRSNLTLFSTVGVVKYYHSVVWQWIWTLKNHKIYTLWKLSHFRSEILDSARKQTEAKMRWIRSVVHLPMRRLSCSETPITMENMWTYGHWEFYYTSLLQVGFGVALIHTYPNLLS